MSTFAHETYDDPVLRKFMSSFNGYLIAQIISREYDLSERSATVVGRIADSMHRMSRRAMRRGGKGSSGRSMR